MQVADELKIGSEVVERLRQVLKGFAPATPENLKLQSGQGLRIRVPRETLPLDTLPYLMLLAIGCSNLGRGEKLAWAIPFAFNGIYCELSSEKFGIRLYVDEAAVTDEAAGNAISTAILTGLSKGQKVLESQVLRPLAMAELRSGHVILRNQYHSLRETYQYFRDGAQIAYDGNGRANVNIHVLLAGFVAG